MKLLLILLIIFAVLLCCFFILVPPSSGNIPYYIDENGEMLENSISEKRYVNVDGSDLGLTILSMNTDNPVLLVCGGGPGIPEYLLEYLYPSVLPKYFTVCYLDYRGTGLSFSKSIDANDMTTERYLKDVDAITDYLCDSFSQDKIYIMGHSFGTYIALNTVKNHPEKYAAYFAMSQITNQQESEYLAYDYMYNEYSTAGNTKMVKQFDENPIKESEEAYQKYCTSGLRDTAMHDLGLGTTRDMTSVIKGIFLPSLKCSSYSVGERINLWRGKINSNHFPVTNEAFAFNAFESIPKIEIPIYFFAGEYDYTVCQSLQKDYYDYIDSPDKEYFLFSDTAHSPIYEDYEKADEIFKSLFSPD